MATFTLLDERHATVASSGPFLHRLVTGLVRAWRIRRDTRELMGLSDQVLHDLGLGRGEVEGVVRHGRERW